MKTTKRKQTPDRDLAALTVQKYQMLWPNQPKIGLDYETTVDMMIEFAKVYAAQTSLSRYDCVYNKDKWCDNPNHNSKACDGICDDALFNLGGLRM